MLYLQVLYQRLNRDCSFREIFAERALMRTIVQFFFREARFRKPAGRIFRPSFNPFRKFFRRKRRLAEEDISNNFEAAAATGCFAAAGPGPTPAKRSPTKSLGEEARRLPRHLPVPVPVSDPVAIPAAIPAAGQAPPGPPHPRGHKKNRHRQRCRTPFQVYREETTPDPSWGPCLRGSKEPESRSCPRCSRSGRCSPAASAAAAWHVRG